MEIYTYTMILSDGTSLAPLSLNGNNFIILREITAAEFEGKLDTVTIVRSDGQSYVLNNCELVQIQCHGLNQYWFIIRELSQQELKEKQFQDTIEMLTECILEMSEQLYS